MKILPAGGKEMSSMLFIINDAPYGNERVYNALRLAGAVSNRGGVKEGSILGQVKYLMNFCVKKLRCFLGF